MAYDYIGDPLRRTASSVDGKHFTEYIAEVKALKRAGDFDAAAGLLLRLISAVEKEARVTPPEYPLPPWFHEQLAIVYRKHGEHAKEAAVLRRYVAHQSEKSDPPLDHMMQRLAKAQSLDFVDASAPLRTPDQLRALKAAARKSGKKS